MEWFYAQNNERLGPVDQATFARLVQERTVTANTLVWRTGMDEWQPYGALLAQQSASQTAEAGQPSGTDPGAGADWQQCVECGRAFPGEEMLSYGDSMICASCKPVFFQRLREGAALPGAMRYGGFWIRVGAKLIDGIIMMVVQTVIGFLVIGLLGAFIEIDDPSDPSASILAPLANFIISIGLQMFYTVWFVGKWGATPGKMACGLKIVRSNGDSITYLRALGRYFAEMVSGFTLGIGYLIAAFDDEKRTLHDHICDTRVIFVR